MATATATAPVRPRHIGEPRPEGEGTIRLGNGTIVTRRELHGMIREWAHENGYEISSRGRVSRSLLAQFLADHAATDGKAVAASIGVKLPRTASFRENPDVRFDFFWNEVVSDTRIMGGVRT